VKGLDGSRMRERVKGRPNIERALHSLHRRLFRFATCRDLSPQDYEWALRAATMIQELLKPKGER
jgi:hypothetical protein